MKKKIKEQKINIKKERYYGCAESIKDLREVRCDVDIYDEDNIFFDKDVVFTGELSRYSRTQAAKIIIDCGGRCQNAINRETDFLIMGNVDYLSSIKGYKTNKMKKAEEKILKGQDLQIIDEDTFIDNLKLK